MDPRRELIAYALVREEYEQSGDIILGLMPLFSPLLKDQAGKRFDPDDFANSVEEIYDIPMTALAAEGLAPKLAKANILVLENPDIGLYRVRDELPNVSGSDPDELVDLVETFNEFAEVELNHASLKCSSEQIEKSFIDVVRQQGLLNSDFQSDKNYYTRDTLALNQGDNNDDVPVDCEQALRFITAKFIANLAASDPSKIGVLQSLAVGSLIAEVVLTLKTPSNKSDLAGISVFIDTPLVLDLLDLSTPELKGYADQLLVVLEEAGIKKFVYSHLVEEIQGAIQAPVSSFTRGERPFGPLGNRLSRDRQTLGYARAVLADLEGALRRHGIEIFDTEEVRGDPNYGQSDFESRLVPNLGEIHEDVRRRQRDAASIAFTRHLWPVSSPESLVDAQSVFVTRNPRVADAARRMFRRQTGVRENAFPPALTDRELAGLLWFAVGGNLAQLTEARLIANCASTLEPGSGVVSKMLQTFHEIDRDKAVVFEALMKDKRARACLTYRTMGRPSAISADRVDQYFDEMMEALGVEKRKAVADALLDARKEFRRQLDQVRSTATETEAHLRKEQRERGELAKRLEEIEQQESIRHQSVLEQLGRKYRQIRNWLAGIFILAYGVIAGALSLLANMVTTVPIALVVGAVVIVLGFWFIPNLIFNRYVVTIANWWIRSRGELLNIERPEVERIIEAQRFSFWG